MSILISDKFAAWEAECDERFNTLKANEEELNRIFIDIYGLQDELTPEVEDKDVTVRRADLGREIRSLISYAVGCMFGRYSLDVDDLAYAGGEFSDKWLVISGKYYLKDVVYKHVSDALSRLNSLEESNGVSGGSLQNSEVTSQGRDLRSFGSDEKGSGVDSFQHCGRAAEAVDQGIYSVSGHSKGFQGRAGDPDFDLYQAEILEALTSSDSSKLVSRGWKDAKRLDWQAIHQSLTTNYYSPDADNIIPITDEEYFSNDIVSRFVEFIKTVYGSELLEENLDFIAQALGTRGDSSREIIRNYLLNGFYKDHLKVYQKRPIYWLFDSGKENGFKALIYMHRYDEDTVGKLRIDYLHQIQKIYENELAVTQDILDRSTNAREVAAANNRKTKLTKQLQETKDYDEKIAHLALSRIALDLDDGIKVNYEKVQTDREGKKYTVLAII